MIGSGVHYVNQMGLWLPRNGNIYPQRNTIKVPFKGTLQLSIPTAKLYLCCIPCTQMSDVLVLLTISMYTAEDRGWCV